MNLKSFGWIPKKHLRVLYIAVIGVFFCINWFVRDYSTKIPTSFEPKGINRKVLVENVKKNSKVSNYLYLTSVILKPLLNLIICFYFCYYFPKHLYKDFFVLNNCYS